MGAGSTRRLSDPKSHQGPGAPSVESIRADHVGNDPGALRRSFCWIKLRSLCFLGVFNDKPDAFVAG